MFSGDKFYDLLREVAKDADPDQKEAIGNMLKAINFTQNRKEITTAVSANLRFLAEYFSPNKGLSGRLTSLADQWGSDDAQYNFQQLRDQTSDLMQSLSDSLLNDSHTQTLLPIVTHNLSKFNTNTSMLRENFTQLLTLINAAFMAKAARTEGSYTLERFEQEQALEKARFDSVEHTTIQITRFELEQEKALWEEKVKLAEDGMLNWSKTQIDEAKQMIANFEKELKKLPKGVNEIIAEIGEYGIGGTILKHLGFDDKQIDAFNTAIDAIKDNISSLVDAWNEAAQAAVDAADKQVEAAQKTLDAEIEARNNGYANSVATAQKELALAKKNREDAIKEKQKAQKAQLAIDSITQASSLVTASAQIWSALGGIPYVGPALAIAAIATMWGTFAAAKIKASQVTSQSEQYGEGGLEFLEGGSHASGNDIDLGVENKRHKRMRAEGGEALAIISKKRTRQYRDILPGIIESLNKGTFEQSYMQSFVAPIGLQLAGVGQPTDISRLERDVTRIKEELGYRYYFEPDRTVIKKGNLTRIIRK